MLQTGQLLRHDRSCATTLVRRMKLEENNYNRMRYSLETEQLYTTSCGNCTLEHAQKWIRRVNVRDSNRKRDGSGNCWIIRLVKSFAFFFPRGRYVETSRIFVHKCLDHYDFLIFFPIVIIFLFVISFEWNNILLHYSEGYRVIFLLKQWKKC